MRHKFLVVQLIFVVRVCATGNVGDFVIFGVENIERQRVKETETRRKPVYRLCMLTDFSRCAFLPFLWSPKFES